MANFPNPYTGYPYPNLYYNPTNPYQVQGPTQTYARADGTAPNPIMVVWARGEAGANAYPVGAGQTAFVFDSDPDKQTFYVKSTDIRGVQQPLEIYDYHKREAVPSADESKKSEIEELNEKIENLTKLVEDFIK